VCAAHVAQAIHAPSGAGRFVEHVLCEVFASMAGRPILVVMPDSAGDEGGTGLGAFLYNEAAAEGDQFGYDLSSMWALYLHPQDLHYCLFVPQGDLHIVTDKHCGMGGKLGIVATPTVAMSPALADMTPAEVRDMWSFNAPDPTPMTAVERAGELCVPVRWGSLCSHGCMLCRLQG
jgi:hypothetical protein